MATFYNQATLHFNGQSTNSNVTEGELTNALSAQKTAITGIYGQNGTVAYAISLVNGGSTALVGLTVTDDLGAYPFGTGELTPLSYIDGSVKLYIDGVLAPAPAVTVSPLTFSGIDLPAGSSAVIIYEGATNLYTPYADGSTILNTATVTGGGLAEPITLTATSTVNTAPSLTIAKAICPETVGDNGQLTYTFVILNQGNAPIVATDDVTVTDSFTPILNPISVTYNGTLWTEGVNYTYDEATGDFATLPGNITVPAATFIQDPVTGIFNVTPGVSVITVTGTV